MKKLLMLVMVLSLVATGAMAKIPPKSDPSPGDNGRGTSKLDYFEDFEGAFPPAGWSQGITNGAYTWTQNFVSVFSGAAAAGIAWQIGLPQDETLSFTAQIDAGDDLSFANMGSVFWCTNANFTVDVGGTQVYDFCLEGTASFVWQEVVIDLAPWEGTSQVITFRYAGDDGADHHLDAINIGAGPPPPDDISFCDMVSQETGTYFTGNTCDGQNLVESLGCEDYSEAGQEHYYEIQVPNGCYFTATVTNSADGALWVLGDCVAPGGAYTCLAYADATFSGQAEEVTYTNNSGSDEIVYLVIDSFGTFTPCGDYTFDFVTDCAVAEETANFGSVKALFR